jgi:hypothetical protein
MSKQFAVQFITFCILSINLGAQIYNKGNLIVNIEYKNHFNVKSYSDLNVEISYWLKAKTDNVKVYSNLVYGGNSTFGNFYFKLYKFDSVNLRYEDLTDKIMANFRAPRDFKSIEEILKVDSKKIILPFGEKHKLTFNLLNFIPGLLVGEYSLEFFLRNENNFGYDKNGQLIVNSISYFESAIMNFKVLQDIDTPNRFIKNN